MAVTFDEMAKYAADPLRRGILERLYRDLDRFRTPTWVMSSCDTRDDQPAPSHPLTDRERAKALLKEARVP